MAGVVVVGSVNLDRSVYVERHPAPGETVLASDSRLGLGGKGANQAVAAARRVPTALVATVGDDDAGEHCLGALVEAGVDVAGVRRVVGAPTGRAWVTVAADGENSIAVLSGANAVHEPGELTRVLTPLTADGPVVVSPAEIPVAALEEVAAYVVDRRLRWVLNLAPAITLDPATVRAAEVVVVNEHEYAVLARRVVGDDAADPAEVAGVVGSALVVTQGVRGCLVVQGGEATRVPAVETRRVTDTTGAGDCFVGTLAAELAQGRDLVGAAGTAAAAAAESVTRRGAAG